MFSEFWPRNCHIRVCSLLTAHSCRNFPLVEGESHEEVTLEDIFQSQAAGPQALRRPPRHNSRPASLVSVDMHSEDGVSAPQALLSRASSEDLDWGQSPSPSPQPQQSRLQVSACWIIVRVPVLSENFGVGEGPAREEEGREGKEGGGAGLSCIFHWLKLKCMP